MCLWLTQNKDTNRSCSSSSSSKTQRSSLGSKCSHKSSEGSHQQHSERSIDKKKTTSGICNNEASKISMVQREEIKQAVQETELNIFETTKDMFKLMKAPSAEIDTFGGNPLEFEYFKSTFKEGVERLVSDQRGRLTRLIKYTSGEAKELIKHCVHADSSVCYDKAMEMLEAEYGSPHVIVSAYLQELQDWPIVKSTDSAAFRKLYRFLLRCQTYKNENRLQELDSSTTIRHIVHKLDTSLQDKWSVLAEKNSPNGSFITRSLYKKYNERQKSILASQHTMSSRHAFLSSARSIRSCQNCPWCLAGMTIPLAIRSIFTVS